VSTRDGRLEDAVRQHQSALDRFRRTGETEGQIYALNGLGEAALAAGDHATAMSRHTAALAIADELDILDQQARAHAGIARAHRSLGDDVPARRHYEAALTRYTELGMPQAAEVRAALEAPEGWSAERP
jgi:tetratricopeptide (TPR) repeat protein